ncbi:MAG TPA: D-alanine--D-alanine ligase family protein [Anaerolineae bacterium]|nr:D-alanine--D-alanine ligase family protein [Anaerolineae bacterium]
MTAKKRVGIIFGGRSGEHAVSLMSAQSVIDALDRAKYEIIPIGITPDGRWLTGDAMHALTSGQTDTAQPATLLPDPQTTGLLALPSPDQAALAPISELDVVFPVMHGTYGEDGTIQGLLELANIPYVGAGVVGSAVGMDKAIFKGIMHAHNLPILPWRLVTKRQWHTDPSAVITALEASLPYPLFTKPANLGSSVGVSKATNQAQLKAGLDEAFHFDRRVVVEQGINNPRELEVAVLGNEDPQASIVGEIRPKRDFYDYVAKYVSDDSDLLIPAPITDEMSATIRQMAIDAYLAIDCAGLGRADMLLDPESGKLYVNEINTIPGFTRISMYPKLWDASGLPYTQLLDRLLTLAIERHQTKQAQQTTYQLDK